MTRNVAIGFTLPPRGNLFRLMRAGTSVVLILLTGLMGAVVGGCRMAPPYYMFIDKSGQPRIRLEPFQDAHSFSEGLAAVLLNGKWGFIDPSGSFVISPQFGWAEGFSDGLAVVTNAPHGEYWNRNTLFGYVDKSGRYVIPPRFNWVSPFSEGLAAVCIGPCRNQDLPQRQVGYIDRDGQYVLSARPGEGSRFSEGLACASRSSGRGPYGFIDRSGRFVIEPRFVWSHEFSNGLAATNLGYINSKGDVVIAKDAGSESGDFSDGWAVVWEGGAPVFIDTTGQVKLRPRVQGVSPFSEDLAAACPSNCGPSASGDGQNWGFINRAGEFVIKPQFGYRPRPFKGGLALVCVGCKG